MPLKVSVVGLCKKVMILCINSISFDDDGSDIYYGLCLKYEINPDAYIAL